MTGSMQAIINPSPAAKLSRDLSNAYIYIALAGKRRPNRSGSCTQGCTQGVRCFFVTLGAWWIPQMMRSS